MTTRINFISSKTITQYKKVKIEAHLSLDNKLCYLLFLKAIVGYLYEKKLNKVL